VTTGSKASTLTPKINGTATTGGGVALTSAAATPAGTKIAGTTVTGANEFDSDDELTIVGSSTTAFAEGDGWINLYLE
jgi:hypothetical protein